MSELLNGAPPKSYYWIAGVALVWDLLGVMAYVTSVTMSPEALAALPDAQRVLYESTPVWATSAFAIAVNGGALGSLLLLLRKTIALPVLIVSLIAVLIQMFYGYFMTNTLEVLGGANAGFSGVIIFIASFLVWFANDARGKGWLS
jgi:hypothetical protein